MKIKELSDLGLGVRIDDIEVDVTSVVENAFFERHNCQDYRKESINFMIKNKIDFHSTCNNDHEIMKKLIKVSCPVCHKNMKVTSGGGNGSISTTTYSCDECSTNVNITIPDSGIHVDFER